MDSFPFDGLRTSTKLDRDFNHPSLDEQPKVVAIAAVAYGENLTVVTYFDKLLWLPGGLVCVCFVWGWGSPLLLTSKYQSAFQCEADNGKI